MAVFRALRKVFRDLVKLEHLKTVPIECGPSVSSKVGSHVVQYGAPQATLPATPFFRAVTSYGYARSFAASLRRDAIARFIGARPQQMTTASLLAFLGITYQTGVNNGKPSMEDLCEVLQSSFQLHMETPKAACDDDELGSRLEEYKVKDRLGAPSSCAAVYSAEYNNNEYAIKMMFNYGLQSNNLVIRKGFWKEYAVLGGDGCCDSDLPQDWQPVECATLPRHPNIIQIHRVFVDAMPCLDDALHSYPVALPPRLNPHGLGRNKTMFLVMPKYDCSLRQYNAIMSSTQNSCRVRLLILAQILEAIAHLTRNGISHRDLKTDNILVDVNREREDAAPSVVLTDFGCCLCDPRCGLKIPYETAEIDKGGNAALMAPEIISQMPGKGEILDYTKSDVWSTGTLVYELFGAKNPFSDGGMLNNCYNNEDIPHLPSDAPPLLDGVTRLMLKRDPACRVTASQAATMICLMLYAPAEWLQQDKSPARDTVLRWITRLCLGVIRDACAYTEERPDAEVMVRLSFLARVTAEEIQECLMLMMPLA